MVYVILVSSVVNVRYLFLNTKPHSKRKSWSFVWSVLVKGVGLLASTSLGGGGARMYMGVGAGAGGGGGGGWRACIIGINVRRNTIIKAWLCAHMVGSIPVGAGGEQWSSGASGGVVPKV